MRAWLLALACAGGAAEPPRDEAPEPILNTEEAIEAEAAEATEGDGVALMASRRGEAEEQAVQHYATRHILVTYADAIRSRSTRSRAEALALAESLRQRILDGEEMADLAAQYSEDPGSKNRGGWLGIAPLGSWVEPFEEAALALEIGEVSQPVETPYGFHIIRRESTETIGLRQILVQFEGNYPADPEGPAPTRSREEARARAEAAAEALAEGGDFAALAAEYSDGTMAHRGGELGEFARGALGLDFDEAVFALEVGETAAIIETPFGFHIVQRTE